MLLEVEKVRDQAKDSLKEQLPESRAFDSSNQAFQNNHIVERAWKNAEFINSVGNQPSIAEYLDRTQKIVRFTPWHMGVTRYFSGNELYFASPNRCLSYTKSVYYGSEGERHEIHFIPLEKSLVEEWWADNKERSVVKCLAGYSREQIINKFINTL
jgi:hypothetical protein